MNMNTLPATVCLAIAGYLAAKGIDGWGWFIVAALFVIPTTTES